MKVSKDVLIGLDIVFSNACAHCQPCATGFVRDGYPCLANGSYAAV